jgi:hypothetical protein
MNEDNKVPEEEHPAYGMLAINKISLGGMNVKHKFFGSDLDDHYSAVRIRIGHGCRVRGTGHDWYRATDRLIEVDLTMSQFADMLTCMNVGDGVPCTIRHVNGVATPELPKAETSADRSRDDIKRTAKKISTDAITLMKKMEAAFNEPTVNKKARTDLLHDLRMVVQGIESNLTFVLTTFQEAVNTTVSQAKSEIASFATMTVQKAAASLPEGSAVDLKIIETNAVLPELTNGDK